MKYLLNLLLLSFFLFTCFYTHAQNKSGNVWCFGWQNQLNFNTGTPAYSAISLFNNDGGSASVADSATGNLLFSTDGVNVWDRTGAQMPFNISSLGAPQPSFWAPLPALIVPMPGQIKKYYIFTTGAKLSYTVIDMALRGGLGDVSGYRHTLLQDTCARITGTFIAGNTGTWVVVHTLFSNAFYAYPVTQAGIGNPVISLQGDTDKIGAQFKMSPDGSMICALLDNKGYPYYSSNTQLFRFNNSTGVVSPPFFTDINYNNYFTGITFSPNSRLLYAATSADTFFYQYDLYAGSDSAILASKYRIGTPYHSNDNFNIIAMQIASDQKIYLSIGLAYASPWLDAIDNPNVYGSGCNYHSQAAHMSGLPNGSLPVFNDHIFVPDTIMHVAGYATQRAVSCVGSCQGQASVTAFYGHPPYTYQWQPGNLTTAFIDNLCAGTYYVTVTDSIGQSFTDQVQIASLDTPQISLSGDTSGIVCGSHAYLHVQPEHWYSYYNYAWNSGETWCDIYPTDSGTYTCTVTDFNGCRSVSPPITLSFHTPPSATALVVGDTLIAHTSDSVSFQWYFGSTIINGATNYFCDSTQPGVYTVDIIDTNGCHTSLHFGPYATTASVAKQTINIYPNPFSNQLIFNLEGFEQTKISLYNFIGQQVVQQAFTNHTAINTEQLADGVYFYELRNDKGAIRTGKVVKQ